MHQLLQSCAAAGFGVMKPAMLLLTFPFQVLQEVCLRRLPREHRPTNFKLRIKETEEGKEPCSRPRDLPAHPQLMYVASPAVRMGISNRVLVLRDGGFVYRSCIPDLTF